MDRANSDSLVLVFRDRECVAASDLVGAKGAMVLMREWRTDEEPPVDREAEPGIRLEAWLIAALILGSVLAAFL